MSLKYEPASEPLHISANPKLQPSKSQTPSAGGPDQVPPRDSPAHCGGASLSPSLSFPPSLWRDKYTSNDGLKCLFHVAGGGGKYARHARHSRLRAPQGASSHHLEPLFLIIRGPLLVRARNLLSLSRQVLTRAEPENVLAFLQANHPAKLT